MRWSAVKFSFFFEKLYDELYRMLSFNHENTPITILLESRIIVILLTRYMTTYISN